MKTCFVIQCFDKGVYDKRYKETFAPAIERGGAKPVRADELLGTKPVVTKIEEGLRSADVAFAEISEDNANVFLELGFALALNVPTVIVCDRRRRETLPFDVAHRSVNFYMTDAQSDYERIGREIELSTKAALLESQGSTLKITNANGLIVEDKVDEVKAACLIALLDQTLRSPIGSVLWDVQKEVASVGVTERMASLALTSLMSDRLVERNVVTDDRGDPYNTFSLTDTGSKYLLRSYSDLIQKERERVAPRKKSLFESELDDDVPF